MQFFNRYRISETSSPSDTISAEVQGSEWVPSQAYLDLYASHSFALPVGARLREVGMEFGIVNVLDKAPPREWGFILGEPGYSRYGDPRRRRFEFTLSSAF